MIDRLLPWTAHMHCDREVDSSGDDRRNQAETRNTSEPRSDSRGGRWEVEGGRWKGGIDANSELCGTSLSARLPRQGKGKVSGR